LSGGANQVEIIGI